MDVAVAIAEERPGEIQAPSERSHVGEISTAGEVAKAEERRAAPSAAAPPNPAGEQNAWSEHPFAFEFHAGIATPVGSAGLMASYAIVPTWTIACGAGTNFVGLEVACLLRARTILSSTRAIYLAAGVSGGPHVQSDTSRSGALSLITGVFSQMREDRPPAPLHWDIARWVNVEFGYESRKAIVFSPYAGLAILTNPRGFWISPESTYSPPLEPVQFMLYAGVALAVTR